MKKSNVLLGIGIGVLCFIITIALAFVGFKFIKGSKTVSGDEDIVSDESSGKTNEKKDDKSKKEDKDDVTVGEKIMASASGRKLLTIKFDDSSLDYTPSVVAYQTAPDFSNVTNINRFYLQDAMKKKLAENNFVVVNSNMAEFFDLYEMNRYLQLPSFITTDSMLHTYHLYFAMLQKNTEKQYLADEINKMSIRMFENSKAVRDKLVGSEWEEAASLNVAFFAIGARLMGNDIDIPDYLDEIVMPELSQIKSADGVHNSMLINELEDYSQYKPRGYYEGDENLEKYFRTMMWYGRRNFKQSEELENRIALLMNITMDDASLQSWEKVYSITSFFAGASDDCGYYEYMPIIEQIYGKDVKAEELVGDEKSFDKYCKQIKSLEPPKINSVVHTDEVTDDTDRLEESKGYRFMGQRFTLDAAIFTNLCYSKVKENSAGEKRMLPTALDVPAAMGSDEALSILENKGETSYENYSENMKELREQINNAPDEFWSASLYGGWLNTIKPLTVEKGDGYPSFMTNKAWARKDIETYLGSWTELKHDTILYSKQFVAEMGGDDDYVEDTRGYVEPEPELYNRLYELTKDTVAGLDEYGIISSSDKENLNILGNLSLSLRDISVKELNNEKLSASDYQLIEEYGGNIEHLWRKTITDVAEDHYVDCSEYPCALVADVATDPNGSVLEEAIGGCSEIFVVFPVDNELHVARGVVFTYHEFEVPLSERMTDSTWRRRIGLELGDDMEYHMPEPVHHPDWTDIYREEFVYDYDY